MKTKTLYNNFSLFQRFMKSIHTKLTEFEFSIEFSNLMEQAAIASKIKSLCINDVDKIVRVDDEFKAIFELKVRQLRPNFIRLNWAQWNTLRKISQKLEIPVYYLIKTDSGYILKQLDDWEKEVGKIDTFVKLPVGAEDLLDEVELILKLAKILEG